MESLYIRLTGKAEAGEPQGTLLGMRGNDAGRSKGCPVMGQIRRNLRPERELMAGRCLIVRKSEEPLYGESK